MRRLTELGIKDNDNRLIAYINGELDEIKKNVGIDDEKIIHLKEELAYFTIKEVEFGKNEGQCRLLFRENLLRQISFVPNMSEYIRELKQVTRQGLYSCVYKAYREMNEYISSLNLVCVEDGERRSIYEKGQLRMIVAIDNTNESVCVVQEAINE